MEREILLTGIGGQGVQLGARVLAGAAAREGRFVMLLGTYGGTMRGGPTDSTLVVGSEAIAAPPIVSRAWSALAMHDAFWAPLAPKLRGEGVLVVNAPLFHAEVDRSRHRVYEVEAGEIAARSGSPLAASLVLVSAYAALTGLVALDSLIEAMRESVPSYRRQHLEANEDALRAGFEALPAKRVPAWKPGEAAA